MADITQEDLHRFFRSQDKPCPFCDGKSWGVTPQTHPILMIVGNPDGSFHLPPNHHPGYSAICLQCGFMRVHEANIVNAWIKNNPGEHAGG